MSDLPDTVTDEVLSTVIWLANNTTYLALIVLFVFKMIWADVSTIILQYGIFVGEHSKTVLSKIIVKFDYSLTLACT
jgi:hypothetical protein